MKNSLRNLAAIAVFAGFLPAAQAQSPTITSAQFPKIGDKQVTYLADTTGISQGPAGANQTWDFTNLRKNPNVDSVVSNIVSPSSTPYAADFPGATVATNSVSGKSYIYMNLSAGNNEILGYVTEYQGLTVKQKYTNSLIQYTTPISFNYQHNDTYTGGYQISPYTIYTNGTVATGADAYGTVLMPNGKTYNNVLRVHNYQRNVDSMVAGASLLITITIQESYSFVQQGRMHPVLTITYNSQQSGSNSSTSKSVTYNNTAAIVSGIDESKTRGINTFTIYPNPSSSRTINVASNQEKNGSINISVINQLGQTVKSFTNLNTSAGANNYTLNLGELPNGVYMLQMQTASGTAIQKIILE